MNESECGRHPGRENHCTTGACGVCWLCAEWPTLWGRSPGCTHPDWTRYLRCVECGEPMTFENCGPFDGAA